jgi:GNAT superfamily N-acetyltransferase
LGYTREVSNAPVAIRPAKRGDLPAIVALFADDELRVAQGPAQGPARVTSSDAQYAAFDAIEADPNNQVYVAERAGEVVGTFQLTFIRQLSYGGCLVAQIESVYVAASERSHGVGALMMAFARAQAEQRGALRLQLTSNLQRERAHRFYERLGFEATHKGMKLYLASAASERKAHS